ncbi:Preprotein translocase SecG subunit [Mycobacterium sp. 283mftsu]|nr:Preprotein translocase SecG subunit [Mycobacterium sp. 283mftsu]
MLMCPWCAVTVAGGAESATQLWSWGRRDGGPRPGYGTSPGKLWLMILALQITLIITSVLVVLLVLLHRAKGGGLSTLFGGGVQSSLSGSTVVEKNLDRLTYFITGIWLVSIIGIALQIKYGA